MGDARMGDQAAILGEARVVALVGHAGVGKTNLALNLALADAAAGTRVTVADLDLVNPYFRSSDYPEELEQAGVGLIAPVYARTTLDTPSLTGELDAAIPRVAGSADERLIIDVGGDDIGATALGRYATRLQTAGARLLYVLNAFRNLTLEPADAAALLPGIEQNSHLTACGVVNCSHLMDLTTPEDVARGRQFAGEVARILGLPLVATVVPESVADRVSWEGEPAVRVRRIVVAP